ncbi:MAG: outer membrane protein assembly factor BamB [Granulosicoccus sp.]
MQAKVPLLSSHLRWSAALVLAASIVGCANEPPPVPPASLKATSAEISPLRVWRSNVGEAGRGRFEPLVTGDQVIAANRRGKITSFSADNGMRRWTSELKVRLTSGISGDDGQIYVGDIDGVLHALDDQSGEPLWTAPGSSEILVPASAGFGALIVRSTDGRVVSLDPESGEVLWTVSNTPPALTLNGYSRPLVLESGVLLGLDDGRLLALDVNNGKPFWESVISVPSGRSEIERLVDIDADIVVDDDGIYLANYQGKAARLEPAQGQIVWSVPMSAGSGIAVRNQDLVVIDDQDGIHKLDKGSGQIIWSNEDMPGRRLSPPAFTRAGDIVVGDTEGYIHVISIDTGAIIGRARLSDEAIIARPVSTEDAVFVQTTDGVVGAYRFAR